MAEEIRNYILGMIVFVAFIVGTVAIVAELRQSDSTFGTTDQFADFNESFNIYDDLNTEVAGLRSTIESRNSTGFFADLGVIDSLISSAWYSLTLIFSSFEFFETAISSTVMFGVPAWIPALAISAITIIIVFAIFAYIFRR